MSAELAKLQKWYSDQCDGIWEHGSGVSIETLDNPGWAVSFDLQGTPYEDAKFSEIKLDNGQNDWLFCKIEKGRFEGQGDPSKLETILSRFFTFIETSEGKD